jgi:hypothetical protein
MDWMVLPDIPIAGQDAELEAIALAGKRGIRLAAVLKLMRPA